MKPKPFNHRLFRSRLMVLTLLLLGLSALLFLPPLPADELILQGPLVQGGLVQGETVPGSRVELDGRQVRVSDQGVFLIAFGRDHPAQSRLRLTRPDGKVEEQELTVEAREYAIQRIEGLPKRKVTPEKMDMERISRELA